MNEATVKLVLVRHGQTAYNRDKIFCGWTDIGLTDKGVEEAHVAGKILRDKGFVFDIAFTSVLSRAVDTLNIILDEIGDRDIPVHRSWRLNERHYGALQGLKHADMAAMHGAEQVKLWRRSYATRPPLLALDDPRYPGLDPKYKDLDAADIPRGESLEDTIRRVLPYWNGEIVPRIKEGKRVIVSASGNSLRAIMKHIDGISDTDIVGLEVATATPVVYEMNRETAVPERHYELIVV